MAVTADLARLPTSRKVLLFVIVGAAFGLLYYQFSYKGLKQDIAEADAQHEAKGITNKKLEGDIPKFAALNARMSVLQKLIDENQKALPTESELPAFFATLNRKVTEAGVEVNKWRQVPELPVESFVKVPVEVELTGTFLQIKKFFASLVPKKKRPGQLQDSGAGADSVEERERIVSIENLSLYNPVVKNREIILTARFTAATYRQEDKKEEAPKPGQPAKAKPAAAPAPASAKPLPPSDTPQGAKARAEDALDKGSIRSRNGVDEPKPAAGSADRLKGGL